jgi:hypothetical protein
VFGIGCEERTKEGKGPQLRKGFLEKEWGRVFRRGEGAWTSWVGVGGNLCGEGLSAGSVSKVGRRGLGAGAEGEG